MTIYNIHVKNALLVVSEWKSVKYFKIFQDTSLRVPSLIGLQWNGDSFMFLLVSFIFYFLVLNRIVEVLAGTQCHYTRTSENK